MKVVWSIIALIILHSAAFADDGEDCAQMKSPTLKVDACTKVLATKINYKARSEALTQRGIGHVLNRDYAKALPDYNAALELDPAFAAAYWQRAFAYYLLGEPKRAIDDYGNALNAAVLDSRAQTSDSFRVSRYDLLSGRALAYMALKEANLAIADFREVLRMNPYDEQARLHLRSLGVVVPPAPDLTGKASNSLTDTLKEMCAESKRLNLPSMCN